MGLVNLEPVFGEPKVEWRSDTSEQLRRFLFYVHVTDPSHLRIHVSDFHSDTWEAVRSVSQLEDMSDSIGIGGSWSEFLDYVMASLKSQDVKLILEGDSNCNGGSASASAKLFLQKSKGLPVISIPLTKLVGSTASTAMANISLQLFEAFRSIHDSKAKVQERSVPLTTEIPIEKESKEIIQSQMQSLSKRQKLDKFDSPEKADVSTHLYNGLKSTPEKQVARDMPSKKVVNRVVPTHRRARVRGVLLQDTEDNEDNKS